MRIVWSAPARRDVYRIADTYADDDPGFVLGLVDQIEASVAILITLPKLALAMRGSKARKWPVSGTPLRVFYFVKRNGIAVKRVGHVREDWTHSL